MARRKKIGLRASEVVRAYINKYQTEGDTWQTHYRDGINAYVADSRKQSKAIALLDAWYLELAQLAGKLSDVFQPARNRQKLRRMEARGITVPAEVFMRTAAPTTPIPLPRD